MTAHIPEVFDHYLAMWNEPDLDALGPYLERSCAVGVIFADPNEYTVGRGELEAMARKVKADLPGAQYRRSSGADTQHRRFRYQWEIKFEGEIVVQGMDVATLDETGLIERIDGFFASAPPPLEAG